MQENIRDCYSEVLSICQILVFILSTLILIRRKMAKKRKASGRKSDGPKSFNVADGNLGPIRTYEDVADSEDDFHINRDKVLLDEGPDAKRRRKWEEQGMTMHLCELESQT